MNTAICEHSRTIFTKFSIWKPHRRNMTGVRFLRRSTTKPTRVLRFESTNCKTGWCAGEVCEHTVDMWVLLTLGTVWRRKLNVHHYMNLLSWADRTTYALSSLASCKQELWPKCRADVFRTTSSRLSSAPVTLLWLLQNPNLISGILWILYGMFADRVYILVSCTMLGKCTLKSAFH